MDETALAALTQALRNAHTEYRVFESPAGNWHVQASGAVATATQLKALENTYGVVASTNRAEFV